MILNTDEYRDKVLGCWLGKNIGGTLGAPFEWRRQVNDVSFYTQNLGGEPLPNDDLDIQLLWLVALEERSCDVDAHILGEYWMLCVAPHWSEYGTAKANMRGGLPPPLSGTFGNDFKDSCGAFIRSEIWACIAPGNPRLAAELAREDAIIDHGNGEGTLAEIFCAAMESAAFVESDIHKLIEIGLSFIPDNCGVAGAVRQAIESHRAGQTWRQARDTMLERYRGSAFFHNPARVSPEDRDKGFCQGRFGWDVPGNIGILLIALLYGQGDFGRTVCTAVNCGEDTDCTAATAGSIFGIVHGAAKIPEKWIAPIGRKIKTACLSLVELGHFGSQLPADVDSLTDRTLNMARLMIQRRGLPLQIDDAPTDRAGLTPESLKAGTFRDELLADLNGPVWRFDFFKVAVDYGQDGPVIHPGTPKTIGLKITNACKIPVQLALRWYPPQGCRVEPAGQQMALSLAPHIGGPVTRTFTLTLEQPSGPVCRGVVEITAPGRPTTMHVPIVLML